MKYTNQEVQKVVEKILKDQGGKGVALPISFETAGRKVVPTLSTDLGAIKKPKDNHDENWTPRRKYNISIGSEESGLRASLTTDICEFTDKEGNTHVFDQPVIDERDPAKIIKAVKDLGKMFLAMRNTVLLSVATHPSFVNNSSVEPPTGIVLADLLSGDSRVQATAIKAILEETSDEENSKLNTLMAEHASSKVDMRIRNEILVGLINKFITGCDVLVENYEKVTSQVVEQKLGSSDVDPTIVHRKEEGMQQIERLTKEKTSYSSLI